MDSWHSYPKVWALGHANLKELFFDEVIAEEKIDGSQFSFGRHGDDLHIRSNGLVMNADAPEAMFNLAVDQTKARFEALMPGWTYRAEYLRVPRHNILSYSRTPKDNLIIFDINTGNEQYLSYEEKKKEAERLEKVKNEYR